MSALEMSEIKFDFAHVGFYISTGIEITFGKDTFPLVVDTYQDNWNVCSCCDVVKAFSPVGICRACTFGGNGQMEFRALFYF